MATDDPVWFTVGLLTAPWWLGLFLHALLAFPTGRLDGRWDRLLVALLYVDVTLVQALRLSFTASADLPGCGDCPANVLLVSDRPDVAATILLVQQAAIGSLVIGGTLVVLALRWRWATAPQRRVLAPVLVTGSVCLAVQAVGLAAAASSVRPSVGWVGAVAFAAVPVSFLLGLLRQQLDRSAVGRLVVDLGAMREGDQLDGLLRTALKDPSRAGRLLARRDRGVRRRDRPAGSRCRRRRRTGRSRWSRGGTTDRGAGARRVGGR